MQTEQLSALQSKLGHHFKDASLLQRALTHRSCGHDSNERLEFLGDAILNYTVGEMLFEMFPRFSEGDLSRIRAGMVCHTSLVKVANRIGLEPHIRAELAGDRFEATRESMLSDALEAVFAAIQLDAGHDAAKRVITAQMMLLLKNGEAILRKDGKTALQEHLQGRGLALPEYKLVSDGKRDQERVFLIDCCIPALKIVVRGTGPNRKQAEKHAAEKALVECQK